MKGFKPSPSMFVAFAALIIAAGGVAVAAIPDSGGTIHGCYHKATGDLRVVESEGDCRNNERPVSWNQKGPPPSSGDGGRVVSNNDRVAYGARASVLDLPGFFAATLNCYTGPSDVETTVTLTNNQTAAELNTWIAFEGSNASFVTIPPGESRTFPITDQSWMFHFAGAGDRAASGPLHLRNTGSDCYFAAQAKVTDT